jgi:predicted dehydrogenase
VGVLEATTAAYPGYLKRIEIHGSEGSAVLEEEDLKAWDFAKPRKEDKAIIQQMHERKSTGGGASDPAAIGHHGHAKQFREFVEAVRKNRSPAIDGHEGRRSVEIILGVYKAAETGKTVRMPLKADPVLKARSAARKKSRTLR